jgi:hypothetical protein
MCKVGIHGGRQLAAGGLDPVGSLLEALQVRFGVARVQLAVGNDTQPFAQSFRKALVWIWLIHVACNGIVLANA